MTRVVVSASNYAHGPAATALDIGTALAGAGYDIVFTGRGTAYRLITTEAPPGDVELLAADRQQALEQLRRLTVGAGLLVSVGDALSVRAALRARCPAAYVDELFWHWHDIPGYLLDVDLYVTQRLFDDTVNRARYGGRIRNWLEVGPLVDTTGMPPCSGRRTGRLLVNFGGLDAAGSHSAGDSGYPDVVTRILAEYVDLSGFDTVLVTGNAGVVDRLALPGDWCGVALGHRAYLRELGRAATLLTTPGVGAPLEAWTYGTPAIFLPPSNGSQYLQLDQYRAGGVAGFGVHLADLFPRIGFERHDGRLFTARITAQVRSSSRTRRNNGTPAGAFRNTCTPSTPGRRWWIRAGRTSKLSAGTVSRRC